MLRRSPAWISSCSASGVRFESLVETFAEVGAGLVAGLTAESEHSDERVNPAADRRVADAQLALHLLEVASRAKEALEQVHLLAIQPSEPADAELALQGGAAASAVETGDRELAAADRAGGDDVMDHD